MGLSTGPDNRSRWENVPIIQSEVFYLEMNTDPKLTPLSLEPFSLNRTLGISVEDYLSIYRAVGRDYLWNYRPGQTHEEIATILHSPSTWMYLLKDGATTVGMAEIDATNPKSLELVHFGLIPSLLHKGIGKKFLHNMIQLMWSAGTERIWLSTCGLDHPKAPRFYENAGFSRFKMALGEFKDWRFTGFYDATDAPQIPPGKPAL